MLSRSVVCDLMDCRPPGSSFHGDSPGRNTGIGCHALLQGVFLTQGLNPHLLRLLRRQADSLPSELLEKPKESDAIERNLAQCVQSAGGQHPTTSDDFLPFFQSFVLHTFPAKICVPGSVKGPGNTELKVYLFPSRDRLVQ